MRATTSWLCGVVAVACVLCRAVEVGAASASPRPFTVEQPDGTEIQLYVRGNEQLNWLEYVPQNEMREMAAAVRNRGGVKGYTVVRVRDSFEEVDGRQVPVYKYVFADTADGGFTTTNRMAGIDRAPENVPRRLLPKGLDLKLMSHPELEFHSAPQLMTPAKGTVNNLVVLMKFKDHDSAALPSRADFDTLFNKTGGHASIAPTGSVRDYYTETSYGQMTLVSHVQDWVELPGTEAYYANGQSGLGAKIHEAIRDALNLLDAGGLDFRDFDKTGAGGAPDGRIDAITFVHSGHGAEWDQDPDRIWSHRWAIPTWASDDGVRVSDYNINPGLWERSGNNIGRIGVICHELGHFFGLPDLYDYSGEGEGIGSWGLMANSWGFDFSQLRPPHFCAWSKYHLGWVTPVEITSDGDYTARPAEKSKDHIYRINLTDSDADGRFGPDEYLLIENRQPVGFDKLIPQGTGGQGGLAIFHVDESKSENDDPGFPGHSNWPDSHYMVAVLQADGLFELEQNNFERGDADDVYRAEHVDQLTPETVPSSKPYAEKLSGDPTGLSITNISASGPGVTEEVTFHVGFGGAPEPEDGNSRFVIASAKVESGTRIVAGQPVMSITVDLPQPTDVQLTVNLSASCSEQTTIDTAVSSDLTGTLGASQRYVTLQAQAWENFGTLAHVTLPAGKHTLQYNVFGSFPDLTTDFGSMVVVGKPTSASSDATAPVAATGKSGLDAVGAQPRRDRTSQGPPGGRRQGEGQSSQAPAARHSGREIPGGSAKELRTGRAARIEIFIEP